MDDTRKHQHRSGTTSADRMANNIANSIYKTSDFLKANWLIVLNVIWLSLISITQFVVISNLEDKSDENQVANMALAVGDIRYSMNEMEEGVNKMEKSFHKLDAAVRASVGSASNP